MHKDVLFRGCTRPAMMMGVPYLPFFLGAGSCLLLALYVTPLWRIELHAPQYPEGLGLRIWVDQITGAKPNDLNSINGLNHYIGMHAIELYTEVKNVFVDLT